MNRDELKNKISEDYTSIQRIFNLIDDAYDSTESQTCKNCRYCEELSDGEYACLSEYMIEEFNTYPLIIKPTFKCINFKTMDGHNV